MNLTQTYINPLVDEDYPDPSVIYVKDQGYFCYATHDAFSPSINNILIRHSLDLVHWSAASGALTKPPAWAKNCHRFWCPHVTLVGDEFRLYYAAEPDTKDGMCLALATSASPHNFIDCGEPVAKIAGSTYQMIDPFFFIDPVTKKHLLYYGSAHEPLRVVELAPDGKSFLSAPLEILYAGTERFQCLREGAFVTYNKEWKRYFLWVSGDNTWAEDSYAISLFWSASATGNFVSIPGNYVVLRANGRWDSPGQNCIIRDEEDNEWIIYHAVDKQERFIKGTQIFLRKMCMDRVFYTENGWPYITGGSPSFTRLPAPAIRSL